MKKYILIFLMVATSCALAETTPDSLNKKIKQLKDSIAKVKDYSQKTILYNSLYKCYSSLGDHYLAAYKDSASLCLDSIVSSLTREIKQKEEKKEEDTTKYNFRFKIYTDFVGFKGDQPNGLVQSELSFGWNLHKSTFWFLKYRLPENKSVNQFEVCAQRHRMNDAGGLKKAQIRDSLRILRLKYRDNANYLIFFKNVVFPIISISKIKDSLRYKDLNVDPVMKAKHIHTFDLVKYSNFNVSGKLNLLTFQSRDNSIKSYIDLFGTFYSTGVNEKDTTIASGERKHNVNSVGYGLCLKLVFEPPSNHFSMEVSLANFSLLLLNNDIQQQRGKQYYPNSNLRNDTLHLNQMIDAISIWNASIRYSTKTNKENKNNDGIFLRIAFFNNITSGLIGPHKVGRPDYNNNFLQLQFGISKNMSDLLKFLKP